jgi:AAHS family 4-hydroxybenzoate transporter-like MFS transporter
MADEQTLDVAQLIDERPITSFNIALVVFSFLILISDGYDIGAVAFAVPHLLKEWQITDRSALGPVFSASLFGILFGSPLFGYLGDRYGRKFAAVISCLTFGIFTLAAVWATSLAHLLWLRALAGVGIGGLLPNMIALNGEYAPRRFRATLIILMFCGVTFGGSIPGAVSNWLVPTYGWQIIFVIGGVLPIVLAGCAALWLPESAKYLVLKQDRARLMSILGRIAPNVSIGPNTKFLIPDEKVYSGFSPKYLFADGMHLITPLLWACFAVNLMGFYFLASWMPTLLIGQKVLSPTDAATATALVQIGGTVGGILIARPMESRGFWPVALLFACAVPCVALIGFAANTSSTALMVMAFLAGFCVLGLQFGLNAASAMVYPTSFRTNGSGWAFGIGRFGSIAGPIFGGYLVAAKYPLQDLFLIAAGPFVIGAIACVTLARLYAARFKGTGLGERHASDTVGAR